jgi:hypothetical protein
MNQRLLKKLLSISALLLCMTASAELVIPGVPGVDYSTFGADEIPDTSFDCKQQEYPGYYGDPETRYQTFWICQADGRSDRFRCPIGTMFDNQYFVCNWWYLVDNTQLHY